MQERKLYDRKTPLKIVEDIPWAHISKVAVVYDDGYGRICLALTDAAFNGEFMEMAEVQLNIVRVYSRLGKTGDECE